VEQYERFMALVPKAEGNDAILGELERNIGSNSAGREAVAELREILALTAEVGLAEAIRITPFLVRGLDYYTGSIFEVRSPALGNVSFGGGGRYDTMVETYGGQPAGAVGFAFGVERLISVLTEEKLVVGRKSEADVMLALSNPALAAHAFKLAAELRAAHVSVFQYVGEAKLGKQFSFASRMGFPFVVVVGEDELASGQFKLKNMTTGEETSVPRQELPACVVSLRPPTAGRNEIGRKE
jgi:histidyl-tRNA synthetase